MIGGNRSVTQEETIVHQPIRVGIIGASPGRSWSVRAHVPALLDLPDLYRITAVSTTRIETARETAAEFRVPHAFSDAADLCARPDVDLVVVAVKVPEHRELVRTAIAAGKAVYCEWPLGNGLAEAEELARLAREAGVVAVAGTQALASPAVRYVKDLVADGFVGEVLSSTVVGSGMIGGATISAADAYTADPANGATMLTIPVGHVLAALQDGLGEMAEVGAILAQRRTSTRVVETGEQIPLTASDQILVQGRLDGGVALSLHYRGGVSRGTNLLWEINGTEGDLRITSDGGHAQMFDLSVSGGRGEDKSIAPMPVPDRYHNGVSAGGFARNIGHFYRRLAGDLRDGTHLATTFDDAVRLHQLIDAIERSAATGRLFARDDGGWHPVASPRS